MKKTDKHSLIEKLKGLEKELAEKLKESHIDFDENADTKTIKRVIKRYIKTVGEAKEILDKYEKLAGEISEFESSENDEFVAKAVVGLRREPKIDKSQISVMESGEKTTQKKLRSGEKTTQKQLRSEVEKDAQTNSGSNSGYVDEIAVIGGKPVTVKRKKRQQTGREL